MAKKLQKDGITILTASAEATAKVDFTTKEQAIHKGSGLPAWTVEGFMSENGEQTIVKLNIASAEQPKFPALTPLAIDGDLLYTPYITDAKRLGESYTVVGKLVPAKPANRGE